MDLIVKQLEPYFKIAEREANKSPCTRRQYGSVIAYRINGTFTIFYDKGYNARVSACCDGNICARDVIKTRHGGSVEIGAEIHSEVAALISSGKATPNSFFILVGFEKNTELYGTNVYPCHSCAVAIKFAGYSHIFIKDKNKQIIQVPINEIINYRISEWGTIE